MHCIIKNGYSEEPALPQKAIDSAVSAGRNREFTHFKPGFIACNRKKCYC